jgi:hypothetical protein
MQRPIARPDCDDTGHRVEALASWDHGIEPYDCGYDAKGEKVESVQVSIYPPSPTNPDVDVLASD